MSRMTIYSVPALLAAILATPICSAAVLIWALFDKTGNGAHQVARAWARIILAASLVRVEVTGSENLAGDETYVFAANHSSVFDILVLLARLPVQFRWLAKEELFHIPLFGPAMRAAGLHSRQSLQPAGRGQEPAARRGAHPGGGQRHHFPRGHPLERRAGPGIQTRRAYAGRQVRPARGADQHQRRLSGHADQNPRTVPRPHKGRHRPAHSHGRTQSRRPEPPCGPGQAGRHLQPRPGLPHEPKTERSL